MAKNSHIVKCGKNVPVTIDSVAHRANKMLEDALQTTGSKIEKIAN